MRVWVPAASLFLLGVPFVAMAQHENHHQHAAATAKPAAKATAPALKQTTCPVSGKPITQDATTEYEGHKVFFCSKACVGRFQEKPETYLPALYAQWYPQAVQTKCPVMGGKVDGESFTEFKGQRIGFCCGGCDGKFTAEPAKYLAKLASLSTRQVHCPVTGQAIDPKVSTDYQGRPVYFSSQEALTKFQADPAKYADKLQPEQGLLARGATADEDLVLCAVCAERDGGGVHQRKEVRAVLLNGKTWFTCSSGCEQKLKADLAKYELIIRKQTEKAAANSEWYTCPMHPEVLQKGPGKCPKCSMDLEALSKSTGTGATGDHHGGHAGHQH